MKCPEVTKNYPREQGRNIATQLLTSSKQPIFLISYLKKKLTLRYLLRLEFTDHLLVVEEGMKKTLHLEIWTLHFNGKRTDREEYQIVSFEE